MTWLRRCGCALALVALLASDALALEKTHVGVRLVVQADNVRRSLDADTSLLIQHVQSTAAIILGQKLPYVTFVPGASDRYVLAMRLARRNSSRRDGLDEIGLHVCMIDRGVRGAEVFKTVRTTDKAAEPVGEWDAFSVELESALRSFDEPTLVGSVLSSVSIADSALCWADPVGWVLPFNRADLCLDNDTELLVSAEMPTGVASRTPFKFQSALAGEFTRTELCPPCGNRLFTRGIAPEADLQSAKAQHEQVHTVAVYVKSMARLAPCPELPPPGGGQP